MRRWAFLWDVVLLKGWGIGFCSTEALTFNVNTPKN